MKNRSSETDVHKTVCMLCFMVCGIDAHVKDGKLVKVEGMKDHAATKGVLCPRGYHLPEYVYSPDRLKYPMMRGKNGNLKRASWDVALDSIANRLERIKKDYGARAVG
ncbi:MAG: molybdopterin-dependent oxidoreductase, partial [Desulfobacterales bacterium]|nr:molybdopterin-dependent oxidoreductase [Desulfobacterales bacterium]